MLGLMQDWPLLIHRVIDHAATQHGERTVVSRSVEGPLHSITYAQVRSRALRVAKRLERDGIQLGDRVATLAWNTWRHLEIWYGITGVGAIYHTVNPRLFEDQIVYIVNHAEDRLVFLDLTFVPLIEKLQARLPSIGRYVVLTDAAHMPETSLRNAVAYEEWLSETDDDFTWAALDENTAAGLCYTSGTTGEPKGVLYSHRSNILHALANVISAYRSFGPGRKILPVVPLFHVNAWALPYSAPLSGASLVFPGAKLDGASLFDLMEEEQVHNSWGVPTVWLGLLNEMTLRGRKPKGLAQVIIGGSAAPLPMIEAFERDFGIEVCHGWGMTEMSPIGTIGALPPDKEALPLDERVALKARQGRRLFMVEMKIVGENGVELPKDGEAAGELFVRGPCVASGYFDNAEATAKALDPEGWFGTGDVARIGPD